MNEGEDFSLDCVVYCAAEIQDEGGFLTSGPHFNVSDEEVAAVVRIHQLIIEHPIDSSDSPIQEL